MNQHSIFCNVAWKAFLLLFPFVLANENDPTFNQSHHNKYHWKDSSWSRSLEEADDVDHDESFGAWHKENILERGNAQNDANLMIMTRTRSRDLFWEVYNKRNHAKTEPLYKFNNDTSGGDPNPILTKFKYLILPIWWSDQDEDDVSLRLDVQESVSSQNTEYYRQMSWNQFTLSYEILPQQKFTISSVVPSFGETHDAAYTLLEGMGYVEGDGSFDGVILNYNEAQNPPLNGGGGWGRINGPFIWMGNDLKYFVFRHEIGHNLGHPHHRSMLGYRKNPTCECGYYDGFDMMSGGNDVYDVSHFPLASKWFFNWVSDSTIIMMQPEGPTDQCPDCSKEGTFQIFTFDNPDAPPLGEQIMGIQIPIMGEASTPTLYSYWLSYRSGNDGDAAGGLSVHLGWLTLGGTFGAEYDSLNYDAHGNTETVLDSFVLPGTCYIIEPALKLMDIDPYAAKQVIPQVCVDSLNKGSDITVSVSFLKPDEVFAVPAGAKEPDQELICTSDQQASINLKLEAQSFSLIHVTGTGTDGVVSINSCLCETQWGKDISIYTYDRYPYAPLVLGAPLGYGAYPSCDSKDCTAKPLFGEAWLLIQSNKTDTEVDMEVSCHMNQCLRNQYESNNKCVQCPDDGVKFSGLWPVEMCKPCKDGLELLDPLAVGCSATQEFNPNIQTAKGWRVWAPAVDTTNSWNLPIIHIQMYETSDCSGDSIDFEAPGEFIDSGNNMKGGPENAFQTSGVWVGSQDRFHTVWVGKIFDNDVSVRCVTIEFGKNMMTSLRIQAYKNEEWENVWIERDIPTKNVTITWEQTPTAPPVPTDTPTSLPTNTPTGSTSPTSVPTFMKSNCRGLRGSVLKTLLRLQDIL